MAELYTSQDAELLREPSYYAIIPASVRYDPELRASAKLLYGELTALCDKTGFCWASNKYFAELYSLTDRTVERLFQELEKRGHIRREVVRNEQNEVVQRRIYAGNFAHIPSPDFSGEGVMQNAPGVNGNPAAPSPEKSGYPSRQKCRDPSRQECQEPPDKNVGKNNTRINNTSNPPKAPQGGEADFDRFWAAYPKKVGKQAARKAFHRAKAPVETLLRAIEVQKCSDQWSRDGGRYIPNPATWLNQGRWDDELPKAEAQQHRPRRREDNAVWV